MFRKALALLLSNVVGNVAPPVVDLPKTKKQGTRKFTNKASGAAALKRAAKKRNNIRKRKGK